MPNSQSARSGQPSPSASAVPGTPSVEFRLAQVEQDNGLQPLKLSDRQLWVLPQPVMTRLDLQSVAAVKAKDGRPYVRFGFNPAGAQKLASVSQRFAGKYLLVSVNNQLVSAPTIGGAMNEGILFVPTVNEQQASQIAAAVGSAPPSAPLPVAR